MNDCNASAVGIDAELQYRPDIPRRFHSGATDSMCCTKQPRGNTAASLIPFAKVDRASKRDGMRLRARHHFTFVSPACQAVANCNKRQRR